MRGAKRFLALVLALLVLSSLGVSAMGDVLYQTVAGTSTSFKTYLAVKNDAHVPKASFSYTIAAGTAIPAAPGKLAVLAGPNPDKVVIGTAGSTAFTANQATVAGTATDGIVNSTAKKYAENTVTVDFSQVSFDEPGVYRYVLTQTASTEAFITNDAEPTRTIDVFVNSQNVTSLAVAGYVMYYGSSNIPAPNSGMTPYTADGKSAQYVNEALTQDLTFTKSVTGNQASKDKYFKFTLSISGAGDGTVVDVVTANAETAPTKSSATSYEAADMAAANDISSLTASPDGLITHDFYLEHGNSITVTGIPKGAAVSLVEFPEDYSSDKTDNKYEVSVADADLSTTFTNTRVGVIPTGVLLSTCSGAAIVLVALLGLAVTVRRKKILPGE